MGAHRHTAIELYPRKSHKPQRRPGPTDLAADPRTLRGHRRWGWSRGLRLLGLIGLLGLLGWGTALLQGHDLFQPPSQSPRVFEPSPPVTRPGSYGYLPLSFEANQGQTDDQVQFLAHGQGYTLFLTAPRGGVRLPPPGRPQAASQGSQAQDRRGAGPAGYGPSHSADATARGQPSPPGGGTGGVAGQSPLLHRQ
jgi:hypothetical protein